MSCTAETFLGRPTAKILLLGTFHFKDAGLDAYKPQHAFDVFSEQRQREIADVVERLAAFLPTKIAIEQVPAKQAEVDEHYAAYVRGDAELGPWESHQIGYRLATRLGHQRVYCVNAWDRHYESPSAPEMYAHEHEQEHLLSEWTPRFTAWYAHGDQRKMERTLRETLVAGNTEEALLRGHGHYLVDRFKVGAGDDYPGPDRITAWFNRNLRIFANLQRITERPDERLFLVIGGGHVPILRHCVQASPEYDLVEVRDFLGT
jgi:hypothetical protein